MQAKTPKARPFGSYRQTPVAPHTAPHLVTAREDGDGWTTGGSESSATGCARDDDYSPFDSAYYHRGGGGARATAARTEGKPPPTL